MASDVLSGWQRQGMSVCCLQSVAIRNCVVCPSIPRETHRENGDGTFLESARPSLANACSGAVLMSHSSSLIAQASLLKAHVETL